MFVYSSLLSFQTHYGLPCVFSALIVCTCPSSPCVFSLCVFLWLVASSSLFPSCFKRPSDFPCSLSFSLIDSVFASSLLVPLPLQPSTWITNFACLLDYLFASSLPVPLTLQLATCGTTLDWINDDPRCPPLIGFVCLYLDCLTIYVLRQVQT